jgi:tetratricopeptide (TPR) repeat protein
MSLRPAIFVSAVSSELRSARQLVANTLTFLGYDPEWQDIFGTEEGDLRAVLRRRIDQSKGVVQLVGECYGAEPPEIDERFGRVSYTQFEALYALSKGKKVWYLLLDESFPSDPRAAEDGEKKTLQANYRAKLKADIHLYHPLSTRDSLEASVLKLRNDLTQLRRGLRRWSAFVAALLIAIAGLSVWLLQSEQHSNEEQRHANDQLQTLQAKFDKLEQGITAFAAVQNQVRQTQPGQKPEELEHRTYVELAKELGVDATTLKEQLPRFAKELKMASNATTYQRANAAYVDKDYNEAQRLALVAAEDASSANPPRDTEAIKAYELAAWAADKQVESAQALKWLQAAEPLTDRTRDAMEWARVQYHISHVLEQLGKYRDAEERLRQVLTERLRVLGPENFDSLACENELANSLYFQGKYASAESEYRAVLKLKDKVLGPDHPSTLKTRNNVMSALTMQGKYVEAETESRAIIALKEKVLGANHPETLATRNNLAVVLDKEGKYKDAESEDRTIIAIKEKVLGPEHPDTLITRNNLAEVLEHEGRYADAEAEEREVVKLRDRVLGPDHPDTLNARDFLAELLVDEGKNSEAESEFRSVMQAQERVLHPDHPDTLRTRNGLAKALANEGKNAEAETEYRAVLKLEEKISGPEHPDTLRTCFDLAACLRSEGKIQEATAFAQRAADGARKVLGPEHPDTKEYEQLAARIAGQE